MYVPLSEPMEVWYFDLRAPPQDSARKTLDVEFTRDGTWNAVMFWFKLELAEGIELCTGPSQVPVGRSL
jgi:type III protein arginine methyltransferase